MEVGKVWASLGLKDDGIDSSLRNAQGKIEGAAEKSASGFSSKWSAGVGKVKEVIGSINPMLAAIGVGLSIAAVTSFFGGAINAASDLNETVNKTQVVFGDAADSVLSMGKDSATGLGMSENAALSAAATYGNLFRSMGFTEQASAGMSKKLVGLAADLASFNNADPSEVLDALRSGLVGETEPLRKFGINISDARLRTEALNLGLKVGPGVLDSNVKAQAAYSLMLKDTTLAQGDFQRTAGGLANSQRINAAMWDNAMAKIGQALLPIVTEMTHWAAQVIPVLADALTGAVGVLATVGEGIGTVAKAVDFLKPGLIALALIVTATMIPALVALAASAAAAGAAMVVAFAPVLLPIAAVAAAVAGLSILVDQFSMDFGDMGTTLHNVADATGKTYDEVKDFVKKDMQETGDSFEEAAQKARENFGLIGDAAEQSQRRTNEIMDHAATERADALSDEKGDMETAAQTGLSDPIITYAEAARKQSVQKMSDMMKDIQGLFENHDDATAAWQDFLDSLNDPWPTAQRRQYIEAKLASDELNRGLHSDDPVTRQKAIDQVNDLVDQYNTLAPGAFESGSFVNPNLAKGIYKNTDLAVDAAMDVAGWTGDATDFAPAAEKAGWDGISSLSDGIYRRKALAAKSASDVAKDAGRAASEGKNEFHRSGFTAAGGFVDGSNEKKPEANTAGRGVGGTWADGVGSKDNRTKANTAGNSLNTSAKDGSDGSLYGSGWNVGQSWVDGMIAALRANRWAIATAAGTATSGLRGKSPPKEGPLREIDKWGFNVASAWTGGFIKSLLRFDPASVAAERAAGMRVNAAQVFGQMGGASGMVAGAAGVGAGGGGIGTLIIQMGGVTLASGSPQDVDALGRSLAERIRLHL